MTYNMRYLQDFEQASGFNNGSKIPPGVLLFQEVYIRCINAFASNRGSTIRAVAWNDIEYNFNGYRILYCSLADLKDTGLSDETYHIEVDRYITESSKDDVFTGAIYLANATNPDEQVILNPQLADTFEYILDRIQNRPAYNNEIKSLQPGDIITLLPEDEDEPTLIHQHTRNTLYPPYTII
ncbi:MAG: hypothetical protein AAF125_08740, partial [Chloroflexota bacterium]